MIIADRWADQWIGAWNRRDLDALLALYAEEIELRSPFAKLYAANGTIRGREQLRSYWGEAMRRMPNLRLEKIAVYTGHLAIALHYQDQNGRSCIETVLFNDQDEAVFETACLDKVR